MVKHSRKDLLQKADKASSVLRDLIGEVPQVAAVLGSGWGKLIQGYNTNGFHDFSLIPGFPEGTKNIQVGIIDTEFGKILVQDGRAHVFEGYSSLEASFPVLAYAHLGVRILLLFSAVGGLNPAYAPGDFVIIRDHIMLFGGNPLSGVEDAHIATVDLYSERIQEVLEESLPAGTRVDRGVYVYVPGPSYETPAEATFLRITGADVVGMSTAPEALMARFANLQVGALTCVSNVLLPRQVPVPSHDMVCENVSEAVRGLSNFLENLLKNIMTLD